MNMMSKPKPAALLSLDGVDEVNGYAIGASAGTGKTYTLEHLVLDRILADDDVGIDDILVVTFTRRATAEMKGRVRKILESILQKWEEVIEEGTPGPSSIVEGSWEIDADDIERVRQAVDSFDEASISTIHAFCQEMLSDHAFSSRHLFDAELVDASELFTECFYDVLRDTLAADEPDRSWVRGALEAYQSIDDLAGHLRTLYSRKAKVVPEWEELGLPETPAEPGSKEADELQTWQVLTACWHRFREEVATRIDERKRRDGLLTYDDLLQGVKDHLHDGLAELLRERYEVILVDEFQDTDPVQWEIFRDAFLESGRDVIVIGDEKQAIYAFRGADVETYREALAHDGVHELPSLPNNYRSSDELIAAYNELFEEGFFDGEYTPVNPPDTPEAKVERRLRGAIGSEPIEVMHLDVASEDDTLNKGDAQTAFIERTADRIECLLSDDSYRFVGPDSEDNEPRELEPGDIYVLTRTNQEADEVGDALAARGVPHAFYRKPGLFETDEALEVIRVLRAIARPGDRSRRRKAMLTPFFGVRLDEMMDYERGEAEFTPRRRLEAWQTTARRREFTKLFDEIMQRSGVVRRELLSNSSERRLTNYRQIFDWLLQQAVGSHLGVEELADRLYRFREGHESDSEEEGSDLQRLETDRSSVQIMTIHKCKGLSAEVVFVCGGFSMREDVNWHRDLKVFKGGADESPRAFHRKALKNQPLAGSGLEGEFSNYVRREVERLFYVAITRARAKVYLPYLDEDCSYRGWAKRSQTQVLFQALEDVLGDDLNQVSDGFEVHRFTTNDVNMEPPVPQLVTSAEHLDRDVPDLDTVAALHPPDDIDGTSFDAMQEGRKRINASYSSIASHASDRGEAVEEAHEAPLPQGIEAGNFVHEVLEYLDFTTARGVSGWREWLEQDGARRAGADVTVETFIRELLDEYDFEGKYLEYVAERMFGALRAPLATGDGPSLAPLCELEGERTAREVSFALPLPEDAERALEAPTAGAPIQKGYFNGEIDLLFDDDDGKVYFADWKSDSRVGEGRGYSRETLAAHVEAEYRKQAAVYTTALVRMLKIRSQAEYRERFGGFFYLFVRGMASGQSDTGQYFERVPWEQVEELHEKLTEFAPKKAIEAWRGA